MKEARRLVVVRFHPLSPAAVGVKPQNRNINFHLLTFTSPSHPSEDDYPVSTSCWLTARPKVCVTPEPDTCVCRLNVSDFDVLLSKY